MRARRKSPSPKPCCGLHTPPLTPSPLRQVSPHSEIGSSGARALRPLQVYPVPHTELLGPLPDTLRPPQEGPQPLAQSVHVRKARRHRASLRWSTPHRGAPSTPAMDCDIARLQSSFPLCCRVRPPNHFHEITPGPGTPAAFLRISPPSVPKDTKSSRAPTTGSRASGSPCFPPGLAQPLPPQADPWAGASTDRGSSCSRARVTGEALRP